MSAAINVPVGEPKLWTKDFIILMLINFFVCLDYFLLFVMTPVYAMEQLGATPGEAGLAASLCIIGALLARLICGNLLEQIGRRKMMYIGMAVLLIAMVLYFGVTGMASLLAVRFLHGVAMGFATTATSAIVANMIPKARRGEGLGYYMLGNTLAVALGPFASISLLQTGNYSLIFAVCSLVLLFSVISMLLISIAEISMTAEQLQELKRFKISNFIELKTVPISVITAIVYLSYASVMAFLSAFSQSVQLEEAAKYFFVVLAAITFFARPFAGKVLDRKGENMMMYPAFIVLAAGLALLSQANGGALLLLSAAVIGLGMGTLQSGSFAIANKVSPDHRLGIANATYFTIAEVGVGLGPIVMGVLVPYAGYRGIYLIAGAVVVGAFFFYYLLHGKKATPVRMREGIASGYQETGSSSSR